MSLFSRSRLLLRLSARHAPWAWTRADSTAAAPASAAAAAGQHPPPPETSVDMPTFDMENPFKEERRLCIACKHGIQFDYKNFRLISQFTSNFTGKLFGRHVTGLCKRQQRRLEVEYERAVICGYVSLLNKDIEFVKDPKLCDVANPVRPHKH